MNLKNQALVQDQLLVNGDWIPAISGNTFEVTNPFNGELLASVADAGPEDIQRAIDAAHGAFPHWSRLAATERVRILRNWHQLIVENQEDLAQIITLEQGKPISESRGEVLYGASFIQWFAEETLRVYGDTIPALTPNQRILVLKQPVGVVAAITPGIFP